jgi:alkaline phosphatase
VPNLNRAKNVIIFVGDGMGIQTVTMARIYKGQKAGRSGEEEVLEWEKFHTTGLSKVAHFSVWAATQIQFRKLHNF